MKMIEDEDVVQRAQYLREAVAVKLVQFWEKKRFKRFDDNERMHMARTYLAELLNAYDREGMFYSKHVPLHRRKGVEPHVLEGLEKLAGPNGYALYRAMIIQKEQKNASHIVG